MSATKIKHLKIQKFRRFRNITIPIGPHVTLIAGQNGTSKSTLLGMLAQPFSFGVVRGRTAGSADKSVYTNNYHGLVLSDFLDLAGRHFMYDCDDVFRLSQKHDTNSSIYQYNTVLDNVATADRLLFSDNANATLFTRNRPRAKGVRFVTGPKASHKPGEGNFPHPVIYLGLNRLWPLAVTRSCAFTEDALSQEDDDWYVDTYRKVLCLDEQGNAAQFMNTREKRKFITPNGCDYDGESCSAGQDNLGQLLTAILSFRHLKKQLKAKYRGGMLLIDELDATLHAYAQDQLLQLMCDVCHELDLQVVATTHSLRMLEKAFKSSMSQHTQVLYLSNGDKEISIEGFTSFGHMSDHLKVEATPPPKRGPSKVHVVFEDPEGQHLFQQICGSKLRKYIRVGNTTTFGAGDLKNLGMLSTKLTILQDVIVVPDGDMAQTWATNPPNMAVLPGGARPETLLYRHLYSLPSDDEFWGKPTPAYTKQFAITSQGGRTVSKGDEKEWVKPWYRDQSKYWGKANARAFKSSVAANKAECLEFCNKFIKLLRARYRGEIPKKVIERTLAPLKDN